MTNNAMTNSAMTNSATTTSATTNSATTNNATTNTEQAVDTEQLAAVLDAAAMHAQPVAQLSDTVELSVAAAYAVQTAMLHRRLARGEKITGVKLGFTSVAKMRQMGVHDVIRGWLTDRTEVADGGQLRFGDYIHPRVEPEVAFLLDRPLGADASAAEATAAVAAVAPALEIIDSRYRDFRFSLPDVIADNTSAAAYVIGAWRPADEVDLANLGVLLEVDGRPAEIGSTAAILGHPLRSVTAAVRLTGNGPGLKAGWVVLAGAATTAIPLRAGQHVRASVAGLGTVEVQVC